MLTTHMNRPFHFMDLPREIRDEIYREVSGSLGAVDGPTFRMSGLEQIPGGCKQHPGRTSNYFLYPTSSSTIQERETIRNLSNTNSVVRNELAEIVWTRSTIDLSDCNSTVAELEQLLDDRPAIWFRIKRFSFDIHEPGWNVTPRVPEPVEFLKICGRISSKLRLEQLELHLIINEGEMRSFCTLWSEWTSAGRITDDVLPIWKRNFGFIAVRGFIVTKNFILHLNPVDDFPDFANRSSPERVRILEDKRRAHLKECETVIRNAILPDSLRRTLRADESS